MEPEPKVPPHVEYYSTIKAEPSYMGRGVEFMNSTSWVYRGPFDELWDESCDSPVSCKIVGLVSSHGLFIEPHGDFIPVGDLKNATSRFTLVKPPTSFANYHEDFDISTNALNTLIESLCDNPITSNLLALNNGHWKLTYSKPVFKEKCPTSSNRYGDAGRLPIALQYKPLLEPLAGKYDYKFISVYRNSSRLTPIWFFKNTLAGSLVQVNFGLRYYPSEGLMADINNLRIITPSNYQYQ